MIGQFVRTSGLVLLGAALSLATVTRAAGECTVVAFDVRSDTARPELRERERLGDTIRSTLRAKLPVEDFVILTEQNVYALLPPDTEIEDCLQDCAVEAGRSLGASFAVTTDVTWGSGRYDLVVSAYDTASANLLFMASEWMRTLPDLEMAVERITREVASEIRRVRTGSPRAVRPRER